MTVAVPLGLGEIFFFFRFQTILVTWYSRIAEKYPLDVLVDLYRKHKWHRNETGKTNCGLK